METGDERLCFRRVVHGPIHVRVNGAWKDRIDTYTRRSKLRGQCLRQANRFEGPGGVLKVQARVGLRVNNGDLLRDAGIVRWSGRLLRWPTTRLSLVPRAVGYWQVEDELAVMQINAQRRALGDALLPALGWCG